MKRIKRCAIVIFAFIFISLFFYFKPRQIKLQTKTNSSKHLFNNDSDNDFIGLPFEITLTWCDYQRGVGLGNRLAIYWLYRAFAFWFDLKFKNDESCSCNSLLHKHNGFYFCPDTETKFIWTQYLPSKFNFGINHLLKKNKNNTIYNDILINDNEYEKYINFSLYIWSQYREIMTDNPKDILNIVHGQPIIKSVFNELFLKIVHYEMNKAFKLYYQQRYANNIIMNEYLWLQQLNQYSYSDNIHNKNDSNNNNNNNIAIHWRCGDILSGRSTSTYGFYGLSYYKDALKLFNLTNITNNNNINVYLIANLHNGRKNDAPNFDHCSKLLSLIYNTFKEIFINININKIEIIDNGTINSDCYLLSFSKYVICGHSSFCEQTIIGNKNNIIMHDHQPPDMMKYLPKYIQTLSESDRKIHVFPGYNLTQIADFIINK